nr:immunoglobulin heavy chain junction region [Macaca mulatta]MOV43897.1 immunoglobulin heavy chain junction region [Macaca mulatta]MOV44927.1 immunoglobulin heavy chain junction region [Macaca mulatta]MOV45070.1 immunoglobulin heavy chain junction region [Macaca mulatta]MOV45295.1 immunoglobulin heavy chain junction region [Macaca mulatta]
CVRVLMGATTARYFDLW